MIFQSNWHNKNLTINHRPGSVIITLEDSLQTDVFCFDGEGRLWAAMFQGVSYRRGLSGKMIARQNTPGLPFFINTLSDTEGDVLLQKAHQIARDLTQEINILFPQPLPPQMLSLISSAGDMSLNAYHKDVEAFKKIYKPVSILPPDHYTSIVLQATEGCSYNGCTFCTFYKNRPFHLKTKQEFLDHIISVKSYIGRGLPVRRTIFLGDANALVTPSKTLFDFFGLIQDHFNVAEKGGIFSFLDGFKGDQKNTRDLRTLAQQGLRRVYIGLESGSDELLSLLGKPVKSKEVIRTVHNLKDAGISVAVIILTGIGGKDYSSIHVNETIKTINQMNLGITDLLYFSELVETTDMPYIQVVKHRNILPLNNNEIENQRNAMENGFHFSELHGTPHISKYDIRDFIY